MDRPISGLARTPSAPDRHDLIQDRSGETAPPPKVRPHHAPPTPVWIAWIIGSAAEPFLDLDQRKGGRRGAAHCFADFAGPDFVGTSRIPPTSAIRPRPDRLVACIFAIRLAR